MNLSLAGVARMTYRQAKTARSALLSKAASVVVVELPRRCLQLVLGPARYEYTHEILSTDVLSPRRVSITWRQAGKGKEGKIEDL